MSPRKNQSGSTIIVVLMVIVILVAIGFGGRYVWHNNRESSIANSTQTTVKSTANSTFKIPELGIEFTINGSLSDLTYKVGSYAASAGVGMPAYSYAALSTETITKSYANCSANNISALGEVFKVQGQYPADATDENAPGALVKQFSSYYVGYQPEIENCSQNGVMGQTINLLTADLKSALKTVVVLPSQ